MSVSKDDRVYLWDMLTDRIGHGSREPRYLFEMAILSGKDFSVLKRFQTEWPRVHARTSYVKAPVVGKPRQCAMVFSARDGKLLATLHPGSGQGHLMPSGTQMAVKEHKTPAMNLATFVCNRR